MCRKVGRIYNASYLFIGTLLIIIILIKIASGAFLLHKMRRNLNFYYQEKSRGIRVTIILSCFITLWKSLYNYMNLIRRNDIKYRFISQSNILPSSVPYQVIICFIDIFAPIAVMIINIRTVNFVKYLLALMKGCDKKNNCVSPSIFIVKKYKCYDGSYDDISQIEDQDNQNLDRGSNASLAICKLFTFFTDLRYVFCSYSERGKCG